MNDRNWEKKKDERRKATGILRAPVSHTKGQGPMEARKHNEEGRSGKMEIRDPVEQKFTGKEGSPICFITSFILCHGGFQMIQKTSQYGLQEKNNGIKPNGLTFIDPES
ncbi:hypothetical protein K1719_019596 [Acacia pycnantha]|nr:hypothetical protein K1719_019596 [Acacia pycnantha]